MVDPLLVDPGRLSQFGSAEGVTFCLVTNPDMKDLVNIKQSVGYKAYRTIFFQRGDRFEDILATDVPEPAHVLVMSPDCFFESPPPEALGARKLLGMACNSTPTTIEVLRHFLSVIERTSATEQDAFSDRFFDLAESSEYLVYADEVHGTHAVLDHLAEGLVWNQQAGTLDWGEQQIVPSGEISVLPVDITKFDEELSLPLEGTITLRGFPILHSGTPSFTRNDQARMWGRLQAMQQEAVIVTVVAGRITALRPHGPGAVPAAKMLEAMFEVDARYQHVWEIGHALNSSLDLLPGNHAMNEVYGGPHGCLHWGLGLTPYTQYHLDIIAPNTTVYTDKGDVVLGEKGGNPGVQLAESINRESLERVFPGTGGEVKP